MREYFQTITRRFGLLSKTCCSVDGVDVSAVQSHILYEIQKNHNVSIQQLSEILGVDITTFSRQIQTLVKIGLVKKTPYSGDKRITLLGLTDIGDKVAIGIDQQVNQFLEDIFMEMTEIEREDVQRSIRLLAKVMDNPSIRYQSYCSNDSC
ncbi:MarR family winged helix-turn-helix transcriptional regulator [Bacillus suaedaesalsae]|uniref:Winged helix-turn-helix transcriptional regulator n=1 Tax=Bacillus suaedaesalsae TaxID=2810349 RepID=A0ABS2DHM1_9BACI|nr:MarR family winged helix-turn-helix transcriptional regulator [Bacillus suaedaesalsae]MBM6617066.1 winged helix-turn-helix transcriptional regulator [Bacillus suaedaesalsae]